MRRLIFAIIIAVLYAACANNSEIPKEIVPQAKMEKIMWDMLQADRFANDFIDKPGDTIDNKAEKFKVYQQVFKVHGITREEFLKSYKFYLSRPDITRTMFDSISAQAERRRAEVYSKKQKTDSVKPRIDSLRKKLIRKK